jgi:hypothetical protein
MHSLCPDSNFVLCSLVESAIWRFNEEEALLSRRHYPSLPEEASTPAPSLVDMETIIDAKARRIVHLNADAGKNQRMTLPNSPKESRFDPNAAQYPFLTKTTERSSNEDR